MMNYARFISKLSAARIPSPIRELNKAWPPEMILLTAGKPNADLFPFTRATLETYDGHKFVIEGEKMKDALQYQPTQGVPDFVKWLEELQEHVHKPPFKETGLLVTTGSQDGLCKSFEMCLEPGSSIAVEEFIYPGTLSALHPYSPKYFAIKSDSKGMVPESLKEQLDKATPEERPKVMYINPTGANPTGTNLPLDRRRQIYQIACDYDLLILEDDPYYYLQFTNGNRVPSFYSMDNEGRVLRFDSFSKILSSGLRLGFVTGPKPLIERIMLHMQVSSMHTTSLSQFIAHDLLKEWGINGFLGHVDKVESFYADRRDAMVKAAEKHLSDICTWSIPDGGMFLWMSVPGIEDTWKMIYEDAAAKNVLLIPGKFFVPGGGNSNFMRASFSISEVSQFDTAFERLASVIRAAKAAS